MSQSLGSRMGTLRGNHERWARSANPVCVRRSPVRRHADQKRTGKRAESEMGGIPIGGSERYLGTPPSGAGGLAPGPLSAVDREKIAEHVKTLVPAIIAKAKQARQAGQAYRQYLPTAWADE